ncbi:FkbM family methyltransferase [Enterovirga aerilata]|uniref:FkbM family methyltransferase n=1 Tax=Enterovirga aerilata TaxID=2730920 RepID=A0A849HXC8_9HYPH|nr:FkbM family methyltransferase [Enterovirga sp. DB1703]NNM71762.1 FkbM family methyltransferase [Enterovirga sp. DB1703]
MTRAARRVAIGAHAILVADDQPTFWNRVEAGTWEPGTLRVLEACLGPGSLFVDIGAWVGTLSLYAASLGAEVVALEADPRALDQLRRNLDANPLLAERVRVIGRALSADGAAVGMGAPRKAGDSMSSTLLAGRGETWTSPGIGARELASELGGRRPDLVKLDIEGGEYAVLPTLGPLLGSGSPLLLALHPESLGASGEADVAAATRRALAGLHGRDVARVEAGGLVPAELGDIAAARAAEWLLTSPDGEATRPSP